MYGSASGATQTSFTVPIPSTEDGASRYLDVTQCLSMINRKRFRQGRLVPVQISLDAGQYGVGAPAQVTTLSAGTRMSWEIQAAPNVYSIRKSWKLAKKNFLEATEEEREMVNVARWNDFKHFYDEGHVTATVNANLKPVMFQTDGTTVLMTSGVEYTQIANREVVGNPDMVFGFFGTSSPTYFSMTEEYQYGMQAAVTAPDPSTSLGDVPYSEIAAQIVDDDITNLQMINELPPYDSTLLQFHPQQYTVGYSNGQVAPSLALYQQTSTPYFLAPSGLIKITNVSGATHVATLRVDCLHGTDRGIETGLMK